MIMYLFVSEERLYFDIEGGDQLMKKGTMVT